MATIHTIERNAVQESISAQARADSNPHPFFVAWRDQNARAADAFDWLGEEDRVFILGMMEDMAAEVKVENARTEREWEQRAIHKKQIEPRAQ